MAIKNITIKGYRSIQNLSLSLDQLTVVTGANGCGKSNLYKAILLIAKAASGELTKTLAQEGGMPSVLWAGEIRQNTRTKAPRRLILQIETDDFNYAIACGLPIPSASKFNLDPLVKEETVWYGSPRRPSNTILQREVGSTWVINQNGNRIAYPMQLLQSESVLSQLQEPHLYPEISALNCDIRKWRFYHNFRTDAESPMRMPQMGVRTEILNHDGHDLAAALQTIREIGDADALAAAIDRAFPGTKLIIDCDYKCFFDVQLLMPGILRPLEARELSDGTLRYLCLIAALLSPRSPSLLALNEPEMSLHADLMQPLAELITLAARRSQIWVTTHSQALATMISSAAGIAPINLIRTEKGTHVESGDRLT